MADVLVGKAAKPIRLARPHASARRAFDWMVVGSTGALLAFLMQFVGG